MKRILLSAFVLLMACFSHAQLVNVEIQELVVHEDVDLPDPILGTVNLNGFTTYRVVANVTNPDDFVTQVFGNVDDPLVFCTEPEDAGFYQHPAGNESGPLNSIILNGIPGVIDPSPAYGFDSYLTVGYDLDSEDDGTYGVPTVLQSDEDSWVEEFNNGNCINVISFDGGSTFILPGQGNGVAGDDLQVNIGQFTIPSDACLNVSGLVQVFTNGESNPDFVLDFYEFFASNCAGGQGCTDPIAINYDSTATVDDGSCEYACELAITADNLVITNVTCFGDDTGVVDAVNVTGGIGTVTHSINNQTFLINSEFDELEAGDYTYYVEDNQGCTAQVDFTISQGEEIIISPDNLSSQNPSCFGFSDGTACVSISGGEAPYFTNYGEEDFSGMTSDVCFDNLPAGNHVIYVQDANGCVEISPAVVLNDPNEIQLDVVASENASCSDVADGCGTALAQGGFPPVMYSIDGWVEPQEGNVLCGLLPNMDYTVTVEDANGCIATATLTGINGPSPVGVNINTVTDVLCNGDENGEVVISGFGGNGSYTYNLSADMDCPDGPYTNTSGEFDGLAAGEYLICAESDGCTGGSTVMVGEPMMISFAITPELENSGVSEEGECDAMFEVINAGGGTGDLTVTWTLDDGSEVTGATVDGLCEGEVVSATVTDENGCEASSEDIDVIVSIYEIANDISLSLYPNPTAGLVNLTIEGLSGQEVTAEVINSLGAVVQSKDFGTLSGIQNEEIQLNGQASGIYFVNITVDGEMISHRIIKN